MSDVEIAAVGAVAAPAATQDHASFAPGAHAAPPPRRAPAPRPNEEKSAARETTPALRAAESAGEASYWSISAATLTAVERALSHGAGRVEQASARVDAAHGLVMEIRARLLDAARPGADRAGLQAEIAGLIAELERAAGHAPAPDRPVGVAGALHQLFGRGGV